MNPDRIHLEQSSWVRVQPARAAAANLFHDRLLELAPDTRALFRRAIHIQGAMLMRATMAVRMGNMAPQVTLAP